MKKTTMALPLVAIAVALGNTKTVSAQYHPGYQPSAQPSAPWGWGLAPWGSHAPAPQAQAVAVPTWALHGVYGNPVAAPAFAAPPARTPTIVYGPPATPQTGYYPLVVLPIPHSGSAAAQTPATGLMNHAPAHAPTNAPTDAAMAAAPPTVVPVSMGTSTWAQPNANVTTTQGGFYQAAPVEVVPSPQVFHLVQMSSRVPAPTFQLVQLPPVPDANVPSLRLIPAPGDQNVPVVPTLPGNVMVPLAPAQATQPVPPPATPTVPPTNYLVNPTVPMYSPGLVSAPMMYDPMAMDGRRPFRRFGNPLGMREYSLSNRFWVAGEYLGWFVDGIQLPALVTTGSGLANPGIIGMPDTRVLFGNEDVSDDLRSGMRFSLGYWFDPDTRHGIEIGGFGLSNANDKFVASSEDGTGVISRPVTFADLGINGVEFVSLPGIVGGSVAVDADGGDLWGANLHYRRKLRETCNHRLDVFVGYRYLDSRESVGIEENLVALAGGFAIPGTEFRVNDSFATENHFHGCDLGFMTMHRFGSFSLECKGQVALGLVDKEVLINGSSTVTIPGMVPMFTSAGLLANSMNNGRYSETDFAVLPEVNVTLRCQVTRNLQAHLGYSFLYLSDVARAGDQIDLNVNSTLVFVAGPALRAFSPRTSDIWAHGFNAGLRVEF